MEIAFSAEDRALLVADRHGRNYNATVNERMYIAASATGGIALIAAAAGGGHPTLFNPAGSKGAISIKALRLAYVSGDNAPGGLAWNITESAGSNIGPTGAAILTATRVAVRNAAAGSTKVGKAYWSPTTNTFTAAPVYHRPIGLSLFTGVAATAVAPFRLEEKYDGDNLIMPGTALSLVTSQATTTALFRVTILFEEVPE